MENKLYGKKVLWNGDSICYGSAEAGNWAGRIAERNSMTCKNYARGGGTIAENPPPLRDGQKRHSVSETIEKMYEEHPDADYIVIEGGTNDADLLGCAAKDPNGTRLGGFAPWDFSGHYDRNTFCGALESIFYRATRYWGGKRIGYIVAQKMGCDSKPALNRRFYFDCAVEICKKWGIPYVDLWNGCYLNPMLDWMYVRDNTPEQNKLGNIGYYIDGQHLTANGYDITTEIIEAWMKTL